MVPESVTHQPGQSVTYRPGSNQAHGQGLVGVARGFERVQKATHDLRRTVEALRPNLGHQTHRRQSVCLPALSEIGLVGVELAGPQPRWRARRAFGTQQLAHGVAGMASQPRDLAHGVALFLQKTYVHKLIQVEHGAFG